MYQDIVQTKVQLDNTADKLKVKFKDLKAPITIQKLEQENTKKSLLVEILNRLEYKEYPTPLILKDVCKEYKIYKHHIYIF